MSVTLLHKPTTTHLHNHFYVFIQYSIKFLSKLMTDDPVYTYRYTQNGMSADHGGKKKKKNTEARRRRRNLTRSTEIAREASTTVVTGGGRR